MLIPCKQKTGLLTKVTRIKSIQNWFSLNAGLVRLIIKRPKISQDYISRRTAMNNKIEETNDVLFDGTNKTKYVKKIG